MRLIASRFGLPDIDFTKMLPSGNGGMHACHYVMAAAGACDIYLMAAVDWQGIAVGISVLGSLIASLLYGFAVKMTPILKDWGINKLIKLMRDFRSYKRESIAERAKLQRQLDDDRAESTAAIAELKAELVLMRGDTSNTFRIMQEATREMALRSAGIDVTTARTTIHLPLPAIETDHKP